MKKALLILSIFALTAGAVTANAGVFRKNNKFEAGRNVINPLLVREKVQKTKQRAAQLPQGTVLYEDFEEWDGSDSWAPEGWTFNHKVVPSGHPGWRAYPYDALDPVNYPSTTYIFFNFQESVDEWMISPEFTVSDGMIFQADCFNAGTYYYDIDAEMYTSNIYSIEKVNDFIIHITTDGGQTWTPLYSIPDEMLKKNYTKAYEYWDNHGWQKIQFPLDEYVGETVKIAFQIVGEPCDKDTNPSSESSGVDNIRVGYPTADISYQKPLSALYYGLTDTDIFVPGTFMVVPVFHPVTYVNTSDTPGAEYVWTYDHTDGVQTSNDQDELEVIYKTDHSSAATSRNNVYDMPKLTGSGEFISATDFSLPGFVQAGGRGEYEIYYTDADVRQVLQLGLSVADPQTEGTRTYADITVPYFGYNQESDRYWTTRSFDITNAEYDRNYKDDENNYTKLTHYGNFYYTSDHPIVIDRIRTNAYGRGYGYNGTMPNAKFTAEIYLLSEDFVIPDTPNYSIDCTGGDIKVIDRYSSNHILCLTFNLEAPIVISSDDCPAFVVAITGFHDPENIDYFSPEMSNYDNPDGLALGWAGKKICWGGVELPTSWTPVYYHTEETELPGEQLISFYIMLDAAYPWLEGESEVPGITSAEPVELHFDSYYDGADLKVEGVPSWLKAEINGRYDKTVLKLTPLGNSDEGVELTISGPGVSKKVKVGESSGVSSIIGDDENSAVEYYNLQGVRILTPQKGEIVIKRQGNTVSKMVVE